MEYSLRTAGDAPDSGVAASRVNRLPKRGESGFTLVEVLVAIVVLSITGLAAAQFAITAIRTSYAQQQRSTAVSLGDDGMERMRAQIANVDANQY
ncbi:type IV pilus modification PilV family protein, partial [Bifidobacterium pseudocatenulatum]